MTDVLKARPALEKSILISEIAIQLGNIGKFEKAEEAAHSINHHHHHQTRDRTWKTLVLQRSQLGQYDPAILTSRKITDSPTRTYLESLLSYCVIF